MTRHIVALWIIPFVMCLLATIEPAPRWNRWGNAILVPGITADGTRQLHLVRVVEK